MTLGGIPASELASTYGTPLLVLDLGRVDAAVAAWQAACAPHGVEISYAAKAFACVEFLRHLAPSGIGIDVCSLGEIETARRAGFTPDRLTLHGAGKTAEELEAVAAGRVGIVAVDGLEELARLSELCAGERTANVLLRLNTGIEAHTHAFVRTGGDDTKFGIHQRDEERAGAMLRENPNLHFEGVHSHVGSQIYERGAFAANAESLAGAVARFAALGLRAKRAVMGGGFGVPASPEHAGERVDPAEAIASIVERLRLRCEHLGIPVPIAAIEPGRAIVAEAGTTLYRIMAIKRQTERTFVVVDGGLFENPRPLLYGARHHVVPVHERAVAMQEVTLCGRSCENDELGSAMLPEHLRDGELLAACTTGAYTFSMAGNYNRIARPAVVAVGDGAHRVIVRRETLDDVLSRDA